MSQSADTVTCTRCGGGVPLVVLARSVTCPHCKTHIELAARDVEELTRYRAEVKGRIESERAQRDQAERWNRLFGGPEARQKNHPLIPMAIVGVVVILVAGLAYALPAFGASNVTMAKVIPASLFGIFAVVFGAYIVWYRSGRKRLAAATLEGTSILCPRCGGPHTLGPGEVLEQCRFCSAALLPNAEVMKQGLAEADRALLEAELVRARAERRGMLALSASSGARGVPYIILGSFLPMTLFGAVAFTVSFLSGHEKDTGVGGIFALWALAMLNVGLIGVVYLFRRARQARIDAMLGGLCARFSGRTLADVWETSAWLDRHWAGSVPLQQMFRGPHYSSAVFTVQDLPALAIANPVGASEDYPGFVAFRVSAWIAAPQHASHPAFDSARAACAALGLQLAIERAGLVALAEQRAARSLLESPDPQRLSAALEDVARAAHALGGTRVDIPEKLGGE